MNERLGHNGNGALGNIYMQKRYINPKANSLLLILGILKNQYSQRNSDINLLGMLNNNPKLIDTIHKLFSREDSITFQFLMNELYEDFYFFATEIFKNIHIREISQYNVDKIRSMQEIASKKNNFTN